MNGLNLTRKAPATAQATRQALPIAAAHKRLGGPPSIAAELSPAGCGLPKLFALNRSRPGRHPALNRSRLCVESVAPLIKSLYSPLSTEPVAGSGALWGQPCGLPAISLAPTTNSLFKRATKAQ